MKLKLPTLRAVPLLAAAGATLIALAAGTPTWAGTGEVKHEAWNWQGAVSANRTLAIHGINGEIVAEAATGDQIEIVADKHARKHNPAEVQIKVVQDSEGITVCAIYPNGNSPCGPRHDGSTNIRNNDVQVDFHIKVPVGVRLEANTVNGAIRTRSLGGPVSAHTVNGECDIETTHSSEASTVNGSVRAVVGCVDARAKLDFSTVNGSITLQLSKFLSDQVGAQIDGSTVNGSIHTNFPSSVSGKWGPRSMHGTIGSGMARVSASTVNGSIHVTRSL